jgi:Family of unknown function (DUF5829)
MPLCSLNHLYVVLDSATYRAIENDGFMRQEFAPNERRTTVRADESYTGLYFYGASTYFELFDVANSGGRRVGDWGLAFGVDEVGGINRLRQKVGAELLPDTTSITRLYRGQQVAWFLMATLAHFPMRSSHAAWVMEYDREFLERWNPRPDTSDGVRRSEILARYVEVLPEPVARPTFVNIIGLTLATTLTDSERLAAFCAAAGYGLERDGRRTVILRGPDAIIRLVSKEGEERGIISVEMRVQPSSLDSSVKRFQGATLRVGPRAATLTFR